MGVTGALMAGSAVMSAVGSISQGIAENRQAKVNAQIYETQAKNIATAQQISAEQSRSRQNVLRGQAIATAARSGLKISGTTANSISQSIMQLQMDNSYEQYNLEVQKQNAYSNAALTRYQGKQAMYGGFLKAGSSALNAGSNIYSKYWNTPQNKFMSGKLLSGGYSTTNQQILQSSGTLIS